MAKGGARVGRSLYSEGWQRDAEDVQKVCVRGTEGAQKVHRRGMEAAQKVYGRGMEGAWEGHRGVQKVQRGAW